MDSIRYSARSGWRAQEDELLFSEIEAGRARSMPLKLVFQRVAERTGRKPNSVRNYYYARVKEHPELAAAVGAFVPFRSEEIRMLLRRVLVEQAMGRSVRAITLAMGEGDTRAMLRYQNKYRALIKTDPKLVKEVMAELAAEGIAAFDPYGEPLHRAGRPRGSRAADAASRAITELERLEGMDAKAFFEGLGLLAAAANRKSESELARQLEAQRDELQSQRTQLESLLSMYRQLLAVNREHLGFNMAEAQAGCCGLEEHA